VSNATEELERGRLAQEVLENRVYVESMAQIETEITERWQVESDPKAREWLWTLTQAHKRLQAVLRDTMLTGQLRSKQIERDQTRLERLGSVFTRR
jgi:hypothetical protein